MTNYYAEFTVVQRHIMQFEAGSDDEAEAIVREGRPDDVPIQILDSDRPVVLIEAFSENEDGPSWYAGDPFAGDRTKWAETIAKALPRRVAKDDGVEENDRHGH